MTKDDVIPKLNGSITTRAAVFSTYSPGLLSSDRELQEVLFDAARNLRECTNEALRVNAVLA